MKIPKILHIPGFFGFPATWSVSLLMHRPAWKYRWIIADNILAPLKKQWSPWTECVSACVHTVYEMRLSTCLHNVEE